MNQFEIAAEHKPTCDICGGIMAATYGGGWDNDRLICGDPDCRAEIVYPTSTPFEEVTQ